MSDTKDTSQKKRVWDLPTRVFHIILILLVGFSWWTGENMFGYLPEHQRNFNWHVWSGSSILALILFRILWGLFGSTTARFSHFVKGPRAVFAYLRGLFSKDNTHVVGHNPLGDWAVLLMLGFLLVMPIFGMMGYEDTFFLEGPLMHLVSEDTSKTFAGWHHQMWEILIIVLGIHIGAALLYLVVKKQNLIGPMITGKAPVESNEAETLRFRPLWLAILFLGITSGLVALAVTQL